MDTRLAIPFILIATAMIVIGNIIQRVAANGRRPKDPEWSPNEALWIECDHFRQQVAEHVAWRLADRPGSGPTIGSLDHAGSMALVVALQSPGPVAEAARLLFRQTESLGQRFVRNDADAAMLDPEERQSALADWPARRLDDTD